MGSLLGKQLARKHLQDKMIQKVFAFTLLGSVAFCVPVAEPDAKADPFLPVVTYGAPLVYHAPNCTTEEEVIQIKKCAPMTENECEDIEVPAQKLEYTLKCQNVTRTHCSNVSPQSMLTSLPQRR